MNDEKEQRYDDDGGKRRLWMYVMPGLTDAIFAKACFDTKVARIVDIDGRKIELWPKIGEMTGDDWSLIRQACARALKLPSDWELKAMKRYKGAA